MNEIAIKLVSINDQEPSDDYPWASLTKEAFFEALEGVGVPYVVRMIDKYAATITVFGEECNLELVIVDDDSRTIH